MISPRKLPELCGVPSRADRRAWTAAAGVVACLILIAAGTELSAQSKQKDSGIVDADRVLTASDDVELHISYFNKPKTKETPVVVLVHSVGGNRLVWRNLAVRLYERNFAVITIDLRGHGQSAVDEKTTELRAEDYKRMVLLDLEAVKKLIFDEHQEQHLNMRKLALIGSDTSAVVAIAFAEIDWSKPPYDDAPTLSARTPQGQDVRALVLLSPAGNVPGIPAARSLAKLRSPKLAIAFWIGVGSDDPLDDGQAKKLYQQLSAIKANEDRVEFREFRVRLRGTDLLGKQLGVEEQIIVFLNKHLMQLDTPWVDRRSRAVRGS